jgi:DNA polymerase-3 subunit gamma/tau
LRDVHFQVSARLWRPKTFEEVVGQKHLIRILENSVSGGKAAQAYLFSGMRGVGKTTIARILAKAVNCADPEKPPCNVCASCREIIENRSVDVVEIDGASNTHVEDVHHLREKVLYLPLSGKYKVYIIDEVHMLSNAAFNALLKTLEEPPPHLVFILATTEVHKIPTTILSRCQHLVFRRISRLEIEAQLRKILSEGDIRMSDRVLAFIAKASEGSLRDALSLFDQAIAYSGSNVTEESLSTLFGRAAGVTFHLLICAIAEKNADALLRLVREIEDGGYDLRQFLTDWIEHLRHLIVIKNIKEADALVDLPDEEKKEIEKEGSLFSQEALQSIFSIFVKLQDEIRNAPRPHLLLEVALIKAILIADLTPIEKIIEEIRGMANSALKTAGSATISAPPAADRAPIRAAPLAKERSAAQTETAGASLPPRDDSVLWKDLLQDVKKTRPNLASYLDQGILLRVEERTLKIRFPEESSFLISLIEKEENKKLLRPLLKSYFKRDLDLTLEGTTKEASFASVGNENSPLVEEALRVFRGGIIK